VKSAVDAWDLMNWKKLLVETTCVRSVGCSFPNVIFATGRIATNIPIGSTGIPALPVLFVMFVIYPTVRDLGDDANYFLWLLKSFFNEFIIC
jgi:hypothetical protein